MTASGESEQFLGRYREGPFSATTLSGREGSKRWGWKEWGLIIGGAVIGTILLTKSLSLVLASS